MRRLIAMSMVQRGLSVGAYVVATMIIARLLTPAEVGVYSLAAAVMAIAGVVREFGIGEYLMQARQLDESRVRAAFGVAIVVAWSVAAAILLLRNPIAHLYGEEGVARVLMVLALTFVFLPFATPVTALMYRDMQIERVLWIQTLAVVVGHVTGVTLAWAGFGYMALAWGTVLNSACMVIALLLMRPGSLRVLPALADSRPLWQYCGRFTASAALETAGRNVHEFVIGRAFGFGALGLYSRANGLFVQFNLNVGRGLSRVLLPDFARRARSGEPGLGAHYGRALQMYTAVTWPFFGLVAVLAPEIVLVMFGSQWTDAAPLLQLLCVGAVIQASHAFAGDLLGGLGQPGVRLRITSVVTPVWVIACFAAARFAVDAIALATAVPAVVALVLYLRQLRRLVGFGPAELWRATRGSAVLAIAVVAASGTVRAGLLDSGAGVVLVLAGVGTIGVLTWVLMASVTSHPLSRELREAAFGNVRG
jgi:O-antigen/teichoic acid export membrane protein